MIGALQRFDNENTAGPNSVNYSPFPLITVIPYLQRAYSPCVILGTTRPTSLSHAGEGGGCLFAQHTS